MMYDKNDVIISFFERTYENLEKYKKLNKNDKKNYSHEITMTINSLLGLLVFTKEHQKIKYEKMNIDTLIAKQEIKEEAPIKEFLRHLRNAIAHGHIIPKGKQDEIAELTFEDGNFKVTLTVEELATFVRELKKGV